MVGLTTWGVGGLLAYLLTKAIYRGYLLHLLRNIPGPKLAAITSYYEFYFNVIKRGTFVWHLEKLHETYGEYSSSLAYGIHSSLYGRSHCSGRPGPHEVHIKDPDYYDDIYASSGRRREKDPAVVGRFDIPGSSFSSISPETHRQCRAPVEKLFSKQRSLRPKQPFNFVLTSSSSILSVPIIPARRLLLMRASRP